MVIKKKKIRSKQMSLESAHLESLYSSNPTQYDQKTQREMSSVKRQTKNPETNSH